MPHVTDAEVVRRLKAMMDEVKPPTLRTFIGTPDQSGDVPPAYGCVMYGGDDRAGLVGTGDGTLSFGNGTDGRRLAVWCCYSTHSGVPNGLRAIETVEPWFDDFVDALNADPKLSGPTGPLLVAGGQATLGGYEWSLESGGQIATVFFQVDVLVRW